MNTHTKSMLSTVLFFGALWGLLEATLGYALQFLPAIVSGAVMMPIGAIILVKTFRHTDSVKAVSAVALIAIAIKGVNFFLPGLPLIKTYNPMIAMLLQSVLIIGVYPLIKTNRLTNIIAASLGVGLLWRALFLVNISINHALTGFVFPQLASTSTMVEFALLYGVLNGLVLVVFIELLKPLALPSSFTPTWRAAAGAIMFVLATVLTYFL